MVTISPLREPSSLLSIDTAPRLAVGREDAVKADLHKQQPQNPVDTHIAHIAWAGT